MTTNLYIEAIYFNSPVEGWAASIWPASLFPNNPAPGTRVPSQTAATASGTLNGVTNFTGLTAGTSYWIAISDPTIGQVRWVQLPTGRQGNSSGDPFVIYIPNPNVVATADILLDQAVGTFAVNSTDD